MMGKMDRRQFLKTVLKYTLATPVVSATAFVGSYLFGFLPDSIFEKSRAANENH